MPKQERTLRTLIADTRGAVHVEYVTITAITLAMSVAVAGLSVGLMRAELRAENVLRSNNP